MPFNRESYKQIATQGFFSEYLPPCFFLDKKGLNYVPPENCDIIQPYCFTMSKYDQADSRRNIYITELGSYLVLHEYMWNNNLLKELIDFTKSEDYSFSPVINQQGQIYRFEQSYGQTEEVLEESFEICSDYIENISKKIIKATGAKLILKLDISNFYGAIYTHLIPTIIMGYESADSEYRQSQKVENLSPTYEKHSKLDKLVRRMNSNQTNGLLAGPFVSRLISEALLTRIDKEIKSENIRFVRYVDDYEIFVFDDNTETTKSKIDLILRKYNLTINNEKTREEKFPYYINKNLNKLFTDLHIDEFDNEHLMDMFNSFFTLENKGTKGAIRFLLKSLEKNPIDISDSELYKAYLLTILQNNKRSLIKACQILIEKKSENFCINDKDITLIKKILLRSLQQINDLEVIWLLYLLIEIEGIERDDDIIIRICSSKNELAQVMLLRKGFISQDLKQTMKSSSTSWILNYELFSENIITEDEFKEKLTIHQNLNMYNKLKQNGIHFCEF